MKFNKMFLFLFLFLFLINFTFALDWDNNKNDLGKGTLNYPILEIKNAFGLGETLFKGDIKEHTNYCGNDCLSKIEINHSGGVLIDDINFYTIKNDNSKIKENIRSYNLKYEAEIPEYKIQCKGTGELYENKTEIQKCNKIQTGTYQDYRNYYVGDELPEGNYELYLEGRKKPSRNVDWVITVQGKELDEWAVWGNISDGDDAEVILNSPADNYTSLTSEVIFNASAKIADSSTITNISLWGNFTGSWELNETINITNPNNNIYLTMSAGRSSGSFSTYAGFILTAPNSTVYYLFLGNFALPIVALTTDTSTGVRWGTGSAGVAYNVTTDLDTLGINQLGKWTINKVRYKTDNSANTATLYGTWYNTSIIPITNLGTSGSTTSTSYQEFNVNTNISTGNTSQKTQTWTKIIEDTVLWNVQTCDSDGGCGFAEDNRTLFLDILLPEINIESPNGTLEYGRDGQNETLNVTFTDTNLNSCWYDYNGTNISIDGCISGVKNSTNFIYEYNNNNMTIYANDFTSNLESEYIEWDYKILENSFEYNNETLVGNQEDFILNITLKSGYDINSVTLNYNGYEESCSILSNGQNRIITINDFSIPTFVSDNNVSIYFTINLDDSTSINTSSYIQNVLIISLDDCSSYTYELFNISLFDEEDKTPIFGDIEFNYNLLNKPGYKIISNTSLIYENISNKKICSNINLTNKKYVQSAEFRYFSDGYVTKLYHIQKAEINENSSQINLYDLNSNSSTEFKVTYQDSTFNFVENAIIQLQRKYIGENLYRIIEAPITSSEGISILHIDLDSVKYRATIVKDSVVLDEFDNLVFKCESELTGKCEYKLLGKINPENDINFSNTLDFYYSDPVLNNGTIEVTFNIPSNIPSLINIVLEQKDTYGNVTLYNKTITSSAGSISAEYSDSLGESYIDLIIYKNGEPMVIKTYVLRPSSGLDWLGNNYIFMVILLFSIVGMSLTSPEWIIVNGIITIVICGGLWLASGLDFVTGLGSIVWIVIAAIILISKISKQEDR